MIEQLPPGAVLLVIADHGQVHVGPNIVHLSKELLAHVALQSGEGRFRWLHARRGGTRISSPRPLPSAPRWRGS